MIYTILGFLGLTILILLGYRTLRKEIHYVESNSEAGDEVLGSRIDRTMSNHLKRYAHRTVKSKYRTDRHKGRG